MRLAAGFRQAEARHGSSRWAGGFGCGLGRAAERGAFRLRTGARRCVLPPYAPGRNGPAIVAIVFVSALTAR